MELVPFEIGHASKDIAFSISVSVAFIQFLGIISFHVYQTLIKNSMLTKLCSCCARGQYGNNLNAHDTETDSQYQLMEGESQNGTVKQDLVHLQYLEDYAENADSKREKAAKH